MEESFVQPAGSHVETLTIKKQGVSGRAEVLVRLKQLFKYLGPAFIVSVAYIDPSDFVWGLNSINFERAGWYA